MGKPLDIAKLRQEYREGRSLRELAKEVGVSHVHVSRALKEAGEPLRKARSAEIQQRMVEAKQHKALLQQRAVSVLFLNGLSPVEIAVVLQRSFVWVGRKLREEGLLVR